jgi:cytoskeleton protein RodZ
MDKAGRELVGKLEMSQLERLREIGVYLSSVRQDEALSLEEISSHTYIPLRILRAIEAGDEHVLPEPVFVQGFIRRYADALGLDGKAIAQEFPIYVQPLQSDCIDEDPLVNQPAPWQFPSLKFFNSTTTGAPAQLPNWPLIAAVAIGAIALGGIVYALSHSLSSSNQTPQAATRPAEQIPDSPAADETATSPDAEETPVAEEPVQETPAVPLAQSAAPLLAAPGTAIVGSITGATRAPVQAEVSLARRSWMQVTVDGTPEFEGIMEEGTTQTWRGEDSITVLAGDAGAVSLGANGDEPEVMGENGSIAEITLTPNPDE